MLHIKKAEVGDIIHNITSEVICKAGETLAFVPVCVFKEYIIWFDRNGPKEGGVANRAYREVQKDGSVRYKWMTPNLVIEDKLDNKIPVRYECSTYIDQDGLNEWGTQIPGDQESQRVRPSQEIHFRQQCRISGQRPS